MYNYIKNLFPEDGNFSSLIIEDATLPCNDNHANDMGDNMDDNDDWYEDMVETLHDPDLEILTDTPFEEELKRELYYEANID